MVEQENSHVPPVMLDSPANQVRNMFILESANLVAENEESNEYFFNQPPLDLFNELAIDSDLFSTGKDSSQEVMPWSSNWSYEDPSSIWICDPYAKDELKRNQVSNSPTLAQLNFFAEPLLAADDCLPLNKIEYSLPDLNSEVNEVNLSSNSNCLINLPSTSTVIKEETLPVSSSINPNECVNLKGLEINQKNTIESETVPAKKRKVPVHKVKKTIKPIKNLKKSSIKKMPVLDDTESDTETSSDSSDDKTEVDTELKRFNFLEKKNSRFFWNYNMHAKGPKCPKGTKMKYFDKGNDSSINPDSCSSSQLRTKGKKHSIKSRKGEGNDLTPNPKKVYNIGQELEELNNTIENLTPVNELPASARSKSRKEKNKLASRASRLKKKAHHEANKIKLFGLQKEQTNLIKCVANIKRMVWKKLEKQVSRKKSPLVKAEKDIPKKPMSSATAIKLFLKKQTITKVAGRTDEFINQILKNVATGDETGGLNNI